MFLLHRKYENTASHQGINWGVDEYTKFLLIIRIWRMKFYFRMRRKKMFEEFSEKCPRFIYEYSFEDVYKNGFCRLDRKLNFWENFDSDVFRVGNVVYRVENLPEFYLTALVKMFPSRKKYQKLLAARSV